jgi:hypothetical protein
VIEVLHCEQGTDEWRRARLGIPTASEFDTVQAKGRGGGESKTRRTYLLKLVGERLTGEPAESFSNAHTDRGKQMEAEARDAYVLVRDLEPQLVGFVRRDDVEAGCSPDGLLGDDGVLEIKTKLPHLQLDVLLDGKLPAEHLAQVQGALWITGRAWCDFVSYWPRLPIFITRVHRDEAYIAKLAAAVAEFNAELRAMELRFARPRAA